VTVQEEGRGGEAIDGPGLVRAVRSSIESAVELEGKAVRQQKCITRGGAGASSMCTTDVGISGSA